jgi:hypothetical protein
MPQVFKVWISECPSFLVKHYGNPTLESKSLHHWPFHYWFCLVGVVVEFLAWFPVTPARHVSLLCQQFHWVHCPGICVAPFHKPLGPHSPGAFKYIWSIVRPCHMFARSGDTLCWWESNPGPERLSDVVRRLRLEPPGKIEHALL